MADSVGNPWVCSGAHYPEAHEGGLIAFVEDNDLIEIDAVNNTIQLKVSNDEIEKESKAGKNLL